jgi:GH15 family glucan-1,4-alpha-glucosidase
MLIEDYALIGDTHTAALVSKDGSIDWLCLPRFDSAACFAKLLGDDSNGYFKIAPKKTFKSSRRYIPNTMVLETIFETQDGRVKLTDFMPIREDNARIVRLLEGLDGEVEMEMTLVIRFDYGHVIPWVTNRNNVLDAVAGPDALSLWTTIETKGKNLTTVAEFKIERGKTIPFVLSYHDSTVNPPRPIDASYACKETVSWWDNWMSQCSYEGDYREAVLRSLLVLKALTYEPTGAIVAAPTTSLPETLGGSRNWDYRYCWLRDATLTLDSLMRAGFHGEAVAWRDWLVRAAAGDVSKLQIMYGIAGERRLEEYEVPWLKGYENSAPVRIGNAASNQFQLDVYGELMATLHDARTYGYQDPHASWDLQIKLMEFVCNNWNQPDDGIWEVRGPRRHFVHSKVMAWVAVDRAIRAVNDYSYEGPVSHWKEVANSIKNQVLKEGFNSEINSFTQYYGSNNLDASLLMIPIVGFLPPDDPRVISTVNAIEKELVQDNLVLRYRTDQASEVDGLQGKEGAFLACSYWLADCYAMMGKVDKALEIFERLLKLTNDLGLLSEEYSTDHKRQVGNFPQAFSHISLINTACNIKAAQDGSCLPQYSSVPAERTNVELSKKHFYIPDALKRSNFRHWLYGHNPKVKK